MEVFAISAKEMIYFYYHITSTHNFLCLFLVIEQHYHRYCNIKAVGAIKKTKKK